jgi:hypothetical protein
MLKSNYGPRINVLFTNLSRVLIENDDIGIPGLESQTAYDDADRI